MNTKYFLFIRHSKTQGNLERRYLGDINEPLCKKGVKEAAIVAQNESYLPPVNLLISGPALRCRQTASILFPGIEQKLCPMTEIDFGVFKGKNADDLIGDRDYEEWLETNCMGDIPGGDSVTEFKKRCCETFVQIAETVHAGTTALVIHGGNIMAIMEKLALPKRDFYEYHVSNCGFIFCRYENGTLHIERRSGNS